MVLLLSMLTTPTGTDVTTNSNLLLLTMLALSQPSGCCNCGGCYNNGINPAMYNGSFYNNGWQNNNNTNCGCGCCQGRYF